MTGPLSGTRVVELSGIGPGPFGGMLLADLGADVISVERPAGGALNDSYGVLSRGRRSLMLDLKRPDGLVTIRRLIDDADVLIDPFRPGVTERLGVGPDECLSRNPKLVYARMTGWGQNGRYAPRAGHDINYLARSGVLSMMGDADSPPPVPLNLVADFGGGGMLLGFGILAALLESSKSGRGQVVDVAMVDGVMQLAASLFELDANGIWNAGRSSNFLQGAAPWYRAYRTADDRYVTVGALEPEFYALLLTTIGVDPSAHDQWDRDDWPSFSDELTTLFASETLAHWDALLGDTDACFAPVVDFHELIDDDHHRSRNALLTDRQVIQPAPAPRFSRTPSVAGHPPVQRGEHTAEILAELADPECVWPGKQPIRNRLAESRFQRHEG
ncbi:CaiB/BaiF CoA transferase family protein [Nocardia jiangxiensis]|uniref:CaiB/BaiF CoA transferase family protein n=1 Tax=Nocardia jiangxiensis TaxID=282685 RepID=UPI0002FE2B26|nr:CaiB/BaiF CoA-transferase family protein [Nocardia jiangxiensis]